MATDVHPADLRTRRAWLRQGALAAAGALLVPMLGEAAAPAAAPKRGGSVIWAIEQDPVYLIPYGAGPTANHWGNEFMYDSLVAWDRTLKVVPALAASWEIPNDHTYVWHLRKGVRFHNGKELDAGDIVYSMALQKAPPPPGQDQGFFPAIARVEAVDKYTVRFTMTRPDASVFGYLAWARYSAIIPEGEWERLDLRTHGIGTGPFKLVEYQPNDHVQYVRNAEFWQPGLPYLDALTLKVMADEQARVAALRAGAIDGATLSSDAVQPLKSDPSLVVLKNLFAAPRELHMTIKPGERKPWADERVRQAVSLAINRQDLIDKVYGGDARYSAVIAPGYGDWPLTDAELRARVLPFDLNRAKQLMADAGYASGFPVTLFTISMPQDLTQCAEVIADQLKQLKITVTIQPMEIATFAQHNQSGTYEWWVAARGMRGDPSGFFADFDPQTVLYQKEFGNPPAWEDQELTGLIAEGLATVDARKRHLLYRRMQELVAVDAVHITLVQPYKYQVVRRRLHNMYVAYTDFNTGLRESWVEG